ncbi:Galectin, carbohydrate recognition domain and Concanavalin A-like lectin/glucanases superfamily domain and Concanavalin A-like lectin/glucanase, subgroup domain-containing protein [Strongyloides ratti]|uniref:Galectin n=1 Tax=Strongyloides ratti TaxID=34506 RepID=A0A090LL82_STRRB|nr:Galectin, carbohydrate recognition domain and Concanavalin A-like lectin/glucanases superfamily domain and Concanavalin A-like lectin/glucanase, subgroup domain-containing protein [Strongyloides ratti]CEF70475.1 Galectin, carbohydrate recognition domain and Concanavalin A-like lectin/glucanases superfamily domain and Concanavalin A-like lectin/glucanase, subgroup domain-containing protein [Strongyloides ratti]
MSNEEGRLLNPGVPLVTLLPNNGHLKENSIIEIFGKIDKESTECRFNVDLCTGLAYDGKKCDNKALHFNPRFDPKKIFVKCDNDIVLNSLINNIWGTEKRIENCFCNDKQFTLTIKTLKTHYEIKHNGSHIVDFMHRIPPEEVKVLYINGKIKIFSIKFENIGVSGDEKNEKDSTVTNCEYEELSKPKVPFNYNLSCRHIVPPKEIFITCYPKINGAEKFVINLMKGEEFVFHFRVDLPNEKNHTQAAVVRNSTHNGKWQIEERNIPNFPFKRGTTNDIKFLLKSKSISVQIDGSHFANFFLRNGDRIEDVDVITVKGDLVVNRFIIR